jgi:hypothetical protein
MKSIKELRTLCNQAGLSCKGQNGKFLSKKELLQLTQSGGRPAPASGLKLNERFYERVNPMNALAAGAGEFSIVDLNKEYELTLANGYLSPGEQEYVCVIELFGNNGRPNPNYTDDVNPTMAEAYAFYVNTGDMPEDMSINDYVIGGYASLTTSEDVQDLINEYSGESDIQFVNKEIFSYPPAEWDNDPHDLEPGDMIPAGI